MCGRPRASAQVAEGVHRGGDLGAPVCGGVVHGLVDGEGREAHRFLVRRLEGHPQAFEVIERFLPPSVLGGP